MFYIPILQIRKAEAQGSQVATQKVIQLLSGWNPHAYLLTSFQSPFHYATCLAGSSQKKMVTKLYKFLSIHKMQILPQSWLPKYPVPVDVLETSLSFHISSPSGLPPLSVTPLAKGQDFTMS